MSDRQVSRDHSSEDILPTRTRAKGSSSQPSSHTSTAASASSASQPSAPAIESHSTGQAQPAPPQPRESITARKKREREAAQQSRRSSAQQSTSALEAPTDPEDLPSLAPPRPSSLDHLYRRPSNPPPDSPGSPPSSPTRTTFQEPESDTEEEMAEVKIGENFPKLAGQRDFDKWEFAIIALLKSHKVYRYVTGERKQPDARTHPDPNALETAQDNWEAADSKALTIIIQTCAPHIQALLTKKETSQECWLFLQQDYKPKGFTDEVFTFRRFLEWQYNGQNLDAFCRGYRKNLDDLKAINCELPKKFALYTFIARVSPHHDQFAFYFRDKIRDAEDESELPSIDDVINKLIDEGKSERMDKSAKKAFSAQQQKKKGKDDVAAAAKDNSKDGYPKDSPQVKRDPNVVCSGCGKKGIPEKDCFKCHPHLYEEYKKRKEERSKAAKGGNKANAAQEVDEYCFLLQTQTVSPKLHSLLSQSKKEHKVVFDTGASSHYCNNAAVMSDLKPVDGINILLGDAGSVPAVSQGSMILNMVKDTGKVLAVKITDVFYVPKLAFNLLSGEKLKNKGLFYNNEEDILYRRDRRNGERDIVGTLYSEGGLPYVKLANSPTSVVDGSTNRVKPDIAVPASSYRHKSSPATSDTWHLRLGHASKTAMDHMKDHPDVLVKDKGDHSKESSNCEPCVKGGAKKMRSRVPAERPPDYADEVSVDTVVVNTAGLNGENYFTTFTDGATLERKADAFELKGSAALKTNARLEWLKQRGKPVKVLRVDGGKEYLKALSYAKENLIDVRVSTPDNSWQNGRAEVTNYVVCTVVRKLLLGGNLPKELWPEAMNHACHILNRLPKAELDWKSPAQVIFKAYPQLTHLRAYGCVVHVVNGDVARGDKFESRTYKGRYVGCEGASIVRVWIEGTTEVKRVPFGAVTFFEEDFGATLSLAAGAQLLQFKTDEEQAEDLVDYKVPQPPTEGPLDYGFASSLEGVRQETPIEGVSVYTVQMPPPDKITSLPEMGATREGLTAVDRSVDASTNDVEPESRKAFMATESRNLKPGQLPHKAFAALLNAINHSPSPIDPPRSYAESQKRPEAKEWHAAALQQVNELWDNNTFTIVRRNSVAVTITIIKGRWVFIVKEDVNGERARYKGRWVAKGYSQIAGVDFDETYASVTKSSTLRTLLAIVAAYDLECKQYDIVTAFLNALVGDKKIYVELPHGFVEYLVEKAGFKYVEGDEWVCLLNKALYGLKQSPLLWYKEFEKFLRSIGFNPMWSDCCLFRHEVTGALLLIYVDDVLIATLHLSDVEKVAELLKSKFKLREMGDVEYFLGVRIVRVRAKRTLFICQDSFIKKLVKKYKITTTRETPITVTASKLVSAPSEYEASANLKTRYQELIGSIMWPSQMTRPDIAFSSAHWSKFLANPLSEHLEAALDTLKYLNGSAARGIIYSAPTASPQTDLRLHGYVDASYAEDEGRKSNSGYVFKEAGGATSWKSGKQPLVSTSSTQAEFVGLTIAAKEAVALRRLNAEMHYPHSHQPVTIYEDNQPALDLVNKPEISPRSKHFEVRWYYCKEAQEKGYINVEWISTHHQAADGLTKALDKIKFTRFLELLNMADGEGYG